MKKTFISIFLLALIFSTSIYSNTNNNTTPQPYSPKEIPQWVKDFRDTEIITLGSLPFVTLGVTLTYSLISLVSHNFDSRYFVNPFTKNGSYSTDEQIGIIVTSSLICVGIGLTNLTINLIRRGIDKKRNHQDLQSNVKITVIESELNIPAIPDKYTRKKEYLYGNMENAVF